jgi:voltage-gated potassium channel
MQALEPANPPGSLRARTYHVIFGHDSFSGRAFDAVLIAAILISVIIVMLDSVAGLRARHGELLRVVEWIFTIAFTLEYLLRLWCIRAPSTYAFSFFGVIDVLAVLPTYLSLLVPGGQFFAAIRVLRVVRVFRVFKLVRFLGEASVLSTALRNSRYKIVVFLVTVLSLVVVVGSLMYVIEGPSRGFTSIPRGIYWAIVTLTTVGYGDIAPSSPWGQALASIVMIMGYGIIAVPTGIVTAEMSRLPAGGAGWVRPCASCSHIEVDPDASFCRFCGAALPVASTADPALRATPPVERAR